MSFDPILDAFELWWTRNNPEPLVSAWRPTGKPWPRPPEARAEWMDASAMLERFLAQQAAIEPVGVAAPIFMPNLGPDIVATLFGAELEFGFDTSWVHPITEDVRSLVGAEPNFENPYWQVIEEATRLSLTLSQGRWITAYTDLHLNADLLVSLMGPENFSLATLDDPDGVRLAIEAMADACLASFNRLHAIISPQQPIGVSWLHAPARGRMHIPSCDASALLGPLAFQDLVLPTIQRECQAMDRCIYHLDGPDALRHLDALLAIPEIHAIQWVYGAGKGPAAKWREVYGRIQAGGKAMLVHAVDMDDALAATEGLRPEGLWFMLERAPAVS